MKSFLICLYFALMIFNVGADPTKTIYTNDFQKAEVDKVPSEFLVLDGAFTVKEEGGNKFLELPGAPLDTFGLLFGPTQTADVSASARIFGTGKGRRSPTFGIGLSGVGGLKLQVSPGKKLLELYKGEEVLAAAPYEWESGSWTVVKLQIRTVKSGEFKAQGKAWKQGSAEPAAWAIEQTVTGELPAGRASVWGNPYSGTPIRYDDLSVTN